MGRRSLRAKPCSKERYEMEVSGLGTKPKVAGSPQLEWYNSMCRGRRGLSKAVIMETTRAAWAPSAIVAIMLLIWRRGLPAAGEIRAPASVNVEKTATVYSILSRGDVDVGMVVSGVAPLLLAAARNYGVAALSFLWAGAGHSDVAPWGTALDMARKPEDE